MRQILLILTFLLFYLISYSQDTLKYYVDSEFKATDKKKAVGIRTLIKANNHYYITDQYLNGGMINYSEVFSVKPFTPDGLTEHYDNYGQIYSTGNYNNGKLSGKWIYYSGNETDTVDYSLVENYYNNAMDSCNIILQTNSNNVQKSELSNIKDFVQNNIHIPARLRHEKPNYELTIKFILDSDGFIKCPKIIKSKNIDYDYEALRLLFLYKSLLKIESPLQFSLPIIFKEKESSNDDASFIVVEENATFQGGDINGFRLWVQQNMTYPSEAAKNKIQGKVIVQFAVNSKGFVVDTRVLRGVHPDLDKEAVRCIESSPQWKSGKQGGKSVKQQFVIPIIFNLN